MSPRAPLVLLLLCVPLGAALAYRVTDGSDRSLAVYPRQEIPLRFDHSLHRLECTICHSVKGSRHASDRNLPKEEVCAGCHEIEAAKRGEATYPPASCATCHPGFDPTAMAQPKPVRIPAPNLKFNHALHIEKEIRCSNCHGDLSVVELATRAQLPRMDVCLSCHKHGGAASGACSTCHPSGADGRLITLMPDGERLVPKIGNAFGVGHGAEYAKFHGPDALVARATCAECHSENECLVCHDGSRKIWNFHPNDWISLHPVPAKHGVMQCVSCHNEQQFCATCHERIGIGPESDPRLLARNLMVHPPASIWVDTPGPQHHGVWASRDISSCASCHREEGCIRCHASGARSGRGISPHPPGFRSQACSIFDRNARVCIKCHAPSDPALRECR